MNARSDPDAAPLEPRRGVRGREVRGRGVRLAALVEEQLSRLIARGDFPRGCKLPTEETLCARFGVSRPVLREALAALGKAGVLRSQRGSGTVMVGGGTPDTAPFPPVRTMHDLVRVYEFRVAVEGASAALAAERHTPETLAFIAASLRAADRAAEAPPELAADLNFAFHRAVACASANPYFLAAIEQVPSFIGRDALHAASFGTEEHSLRAARVHAEHRRIHDAIRQRDAAAARAEMERHINAARDHVLARLPLS